MAGKKKARKKQTTVSKAACGAAETQTATAGRGGSPESIPVPASLMRSSVYRKLPVGVRAQVDEAILARPAASPTLEAIAERFKLHERFGISSTSLRSYAGKLERYVRPAVGAQIMAGVLGCLPPGYRRRLLAGSQVLLLSRVVQALLNSESAEMSVADLAKLASVLSSMARQGASTPRRAAGGRDSDQAARRGGRRSSTGKHSADEAGPIDAGDPAKLAQTVRMLYGLPWPPDEKDRPCAEDATDTRC